MKKPLFFLVLFLLLHIGEGGKLYAQKQGQLRIDSLLQELPKQKEDTNKVKLLGDLSLIYHTVNPGEGIKYAQQGIALSIKLKWEKGLASNNNSLGYNYEIKSDYTGAFACFDTALKINRKIGYNKGVISVTSSFGGLYQLESNYPKALEYDFEALKMNEAQNDKNGIANCMINIGTVYALLPDYPKALKYFFDALKIDQEINNKLGIAAIFLDISVVYQRQGNYPDALEYGLKGLEYGNEYGFKYIIAPSLDNLSVIYRAQRNYSKSLEYAFKAVKIDQELGYKNNLSTCFYNIGNVYLNIAKDTTGNILPDSLIPSNKTLDLVKAVDYFSRSVVLYKEMGDLNDLRASFLSLSEVQSLAGNYKEAYESYKQYVSAKDSLFSVESNKKIANLEANHQVELKEKQIQVQNLQIIAGKNERKYYLAGLGMLVLVSIGLFGRYRIVNRNKKQLEDKNRLIAAEKENADTQRMRAENSERVKQQFLANMSHEIRTPMNAVSGMTDLLIAKQPRPDQLNYLKVISKSSDILLHIINDILDLSKIEVGKMELENIDFSLAETIAQVRDTLSFRAEEKGLQLITTIDDKVNDILLGDPFRLNQILVNLGGNAIKFTQKGSVEIRIERVSEEGGIEQLKFTVIDTGIGIPADKLQNLFESFKQVNRSDTRKYGGTGLGLSISKQLVELQGGNINVGSIEGSGTVFSFILDYPAGSKEQLSKRILDEQKADGSMLNGLRILLADDNEYNRLVVAETLHLKAEVTIDEAINGLKAVQLMEKNDYDVVLMDVQMPEMNGFEATDYIRAKLPAPKNQVPVIALTASMLRLDIEMCYRHGMNTFIPKPFKAWQLITAIAEQTGRKQAAALLAIKEETVQSNAIVTGWVTDLTYLTKFCEGDEERIKKYINIYLKAVPGFADKVQAAIAAKDFIEIAALMHTFKPKWMMMGMKQTIELGHKIEILCNEPGNEKRISEYLALLMEQNENSVKELADNC